MLYFGIDFLWLAVIYVVNNEEIMVDVENWLYMMNFDGKNILFNYINNKT